MDSRYIIAMDVLIEKGKAPNREIVLPMVDWKHEVPVTINFGVPAVGIAKIKAGATEIKADITLENSKTIRDLVRAGVYPAVMIYDVEKDENGNIIAGKLGEVSLGDSNADPSIPPIKFEGYE